ncbi:MAG: efflux RND transporter periplasmic adaptor subunit [FCB group bacterium]|nr:efflux RND transporter periplasmic adaptor subunit [FCB group bacterium]
MIKQMIILLLISAMMLGCGGNEQASDTKEETSIAVRTSQVIQQDFSVTLDLGGTLRGDRQTTIPAKVQSSVTDVLVKRGQKVKAGDLLIQLDPGGVTSQFRQAEAVYLNAGKQLDKMKALYKAGAVAETTLDAAETEFKVGQANFEAVRQAIEIRSLFDGVVADIYVRLGDEVSPGLPLVEIADMTALRMILDVPTSQLGELRVGLPVMVESPLANGRIMSGTVFSIADVADKVTRSFEVECRFPAPPEGFAPGTYVRAGIEIATLSAAKVVPNDAVLYRTGEASIYVLTSDTVALVPVQVLAANAEGTAVDGEMQVGQRVVVVGQKNLTPGSKVREADL